MSKLVDSEGKQIRPGYYLLLNSDMTDMFLVVKAGGVLWMDAKNGFFHQMTDETDTSKWLQVEEGL